MRAALIAGAVLVAAGLFILIRGASYTREESVFKLGDWRRRYSESAASPNGWAASRSVLDSCSSWLGLKSAEDSKTDDADCILRRRL